MVMNSKYLLNSTVVLYFSGAYFREQLESLALGLDELKKKKQYNSKSARDVGMQIAGCHAQFASAAAAIITDWMKVDHKNGTGKAWGDAILEVATILANNSKCARKHDEVFVVGRPESFGGKGSGSPYQSKLAYLRIVPEKRVEGFDPKRLLSTSDENWLSFDKPIYEYFSKSTRMPNTTLACDYLLSVGSCVIISGESLSTSVVLDILRILVSAARLLIFFDFAFGMISCKDKVIFVIVRNVHSRYIYAPFSVITRPNYPTRTRTETRQDVQTYIHAMGRVISVVYKIVMFMSIQCDESTRERMDNHRQELDFFGASRLANTRPGTNASLTDEDHLYLFEDAGFQTMMTGELQRICKDARDARQMAREHEARQVEPEYVEWQHNKIATALGKGKAKGKKERISLLDIARARQDSMMLEDDGEAEFGSTQDLSNIFGEI